MATLPTAAVYNGLAGGGAAVTSRPQAEDTT